MTADDFLDDDALHRLTKRRRRDAQIKELTAMGIQHRVRAGDGSPVVLWSHVIELLGGVASAKVDAPPAFIWD